MGKPEKPWKKLSGKTVYDNKWIRVEEHQVINPAGGQGIYGKVCLKNIAIGVIPLDSEANTWLVGQHRYTLNRYSWEIPEGDCPLGSDPLESAKRELKEETGLSAQKWTELIRIHTSNSVTDELGIIFLAEDLKQGEQSLDETEQDLKVKKIALKEAVDQVMQGEITDSMSMAGLLALARIKKC